MAKHGFIGEPEENETLLEKTRVKTEKLYYTVRYDVLKNHKKQVRKVLDDVSGA